mgnify:CR=1 FL=1
MHRSSSAVWRKSDAALQALVWARTQRHGGFGGKKHQNCNLTDSFAFCLTDFGADGDTSCTLASQHVCFYPNVDMRAMPNVWPCINVIIFYKALSMSVVRRCRRVSFTAVHTGSPAPTARWQGQARVERVRAVPSPNRVESSKAAKPVLMCADDGEPEGQAWPDPCWARPACECVASPT